MSTTGDQIYVLAQKFFPLARTLVDTLTAALKDDPLCLLDAESRRLVEPETQGLERRFVVTDFEPIAVG